ncbi:hypothetical protein [uncultured Psychrobacter sp.]|uniref:hypothetical protein n=1 Tax=uncultured Psychrobacter sp. TaxID=259303 RepID=UPI0030DCC1E3
MANWCANNLEITGSDQEIEQIEKLLLNKQGFLDFNTLIPMPKEFLGLFLNIFEGNAQVNTAYKDRLSELHCDAFVEKLAKLYTTTKNPAYLIEDATALFENSTIFKADESIEQSILNAANAWFISSNGSQNHSTHPIFNHVVSIVLKAIETHNEAHLLLAHGHTSQHEWSRTNWGTKSNVCFESSGRLHQDGKIAYSFSTSAVPADVWFDTLLDKISAMENNNANICLKYVESGFLLGGEAGIGADGVAYKKSYSEEKVCGILGLDYASVFDDEEEAI